MNKLKYILAAFTMFMAFGVTVSAQAPSSTPVPTVCRVFEQAAEEASDLAKRNGIERDSFKAQLDIANQRIAVKDEEVANAREQRDFYKKAFEDLQKVDANNQKIDTNSQMIIDNLRLQLNDYKTENLSLRSENSSLRKSREWRAILGTTVGFGAGYYLGNKK